MSKDPSAKLDFAVDWSAWLEDDETLMNSEWLEPDDGLTLTAPTILAGKTIVWVAGGVVGETYRLTNRVTTSAGRIDDRTLSIYVVER